MAIVDQINAITGVKTGGNIEDALKNMSAAMNTAYVEEFTYQKISDTDMMISEHTYDVAANYCKAGKPVMFHLPKIENDQHEVIHLETWLPIVGFSIDENGFPVFMIHQIDTYTEIEIDGTIGIVLDLT